jgi:hypothetical protein
MPHDESGFKAIFRAIPNEPIFAVNHNKIKPVAPNAHEAAKLF